MGKAPVKRGRDFLGMAVEQRLSNLSLVCGEAEHGGQSLGQESQRSVALWQLLPSSLGLCVVWRKRHQLQRASGKGLIWKNLHRVLSEWARPSKGVV